MFSSDAPKQCFSGWKSHIYHVWTRLIVKDVCKHLRIQMWQIWMQKPFQLTLGKGIHRTTTLGKSVINFWGCLCDIMEFLWHQNQNVPLTFHWVKAQQVEHRVAMVTAGEFESKQSLSSSNSDCVYMSKISLIRSEFGIKFWSDALCSWTLKILIRLELLFTCFTLAIGIKCLVMRRCPINAGNSRRRSDFLVNKKEP